MKPSDKNPTRLRLQVFLSHNGVCSRRRALDIIKEGHVTLNDRVCLEPSTPVNPDKDCVCVDRKEVKGQSYEYILLNKPDGYTTTKLDRFAERTVSDLLPSKFRILSPVGRLDKDTEGLLLFTNDGDIAYRLTHPKFNIDKTYFVRIMGRLETDKKTRVEKGVYVDGRRTSPAKIKNVKLLKDKTELMITIHEGRKRQIRFMFAKVGHRVVYLERLMQGPLMLGSLKKGKWRPLSRQEIGTLKKL